MKDFSQPIPIYYLGHLVASLKSHGFLIEQWLQDQGIEIDKIIESDIQINAKQLDSLLGIALLQPKLQALGLDIGHRLQIAHHGTFGLALLNCETIAQLLEFVRQYIVIRVPFIELTIIEDSDNVLVLAKDTHWEGVLHRFVIEAVTGAMFNIFLALKQKLPELSIKTMLFDYSAPHYVDKYTRFSKVETIFDQAYCGIKIDKNLLEMTIPFVDKLSFLQAEQACQQELNKLWQYSTYKGKVQQILMRYRNTRPSLNQLAGDLNVSSRSLHRYLENEGTSFKVLLDEHQSRLAKQSLLNHGYSVSQTAISLGFVDVANFRRAFKRWFNCTPSEFIKHAQKKSNNDK